MKRKIRTVKIARFPSVPGECRGGLPMLSAFAAAALCLAPLVAFADNVSDAAAGGVTVSGDTSFRVAETSAGMALVFTNTASEITVTATKSLFLSRVLLVGGGGGGGGQRGAGGGAGGFLEHSNVAYLETGNELTICVGAGGAGGAGMVAAAEDTSTARGENGGNTSLSSSSLNISYTAYGGGAGSGAGGKVALSGLDGGSGGGGSANRKNLPGAALADQGNRGGYGTNDSGTDYCACGGGGGAGAVGGNGSFLSTNGYYTSFGGNGGDGVASDITGETVWYAGGGGGSTFSRDMPTNATRLSDPGEGGNGGGGDAGGGNGANAPLAEFQNTYRLASDGVDGLGGGGGGGCMWKANNADASWTLQAGGRGGCGTVILLLSDSVGESPVINYAKAKACHNNVDFTVSVGSMGADATSVDAYAVTSVQTSDNARAKGSSYDCLMESMTFEAVLGAWFDTGIVIDDHRIEIDFDYVGDPDTQTGISIWMGTDEWETGGKTHLSTLNGALWYCVNGVESSTAISKGDRHTVVYNADGRLLIDGVDSGTVDSPSSVNTLKIGRRGTARNWCYGRIYRVRIWDKTGKLVGDYLPAVTKGVVCFYDTVNDACLFSRAATATEAAQTAIGNFTNFASHVSNSTRTAKAGITSAADSSQLCWIDTGIVPTNCQVEVDFYLSSLSTAFYVFGTEGNATNVNFACLNKSAYWSEGLAEYSKSSAVAVGEHTLVYNKLEDNGVYLDGVYLGPVSTKMTGCLEPEYSIRIGSRYTKLFPTGFKRLWPGGDIIRSFKITAADGTVLRDMTPAECCGLMGMYDEVSKQMFFNDGGGALEADDASCTVRTYSDIHDFAAGDEGVVTTTNLIASQSSTSLISGELTLKANAAYNAQILLRNNLGVWSQPVDLLFDTWSKPSKFGLVILVR